MTILFDNDETEYLRWVEAHPEGFVANVDRSGSVPHYPMIHRASHAAVSSARIGNFTTGDYFKVCADDLVALEAWIERERGRKPTRCAVCL